MIKGQYTSVWSNGSVTTSCKLDPTNGKLFPEIASTIDNNPGCLENEFFQTPDGEGYQVCPVCHRFITKTVMSPDDTGKGLHESSVCSDPDCESNQ
jgi:hypothetical protein